MGRALWFVRLIKDAFPGRFLGARATRLPILGRLVDRWLFDGDDLVFLPRDRAVQTITVDADIERPESVLLPSRVVEHFIELASVHWIMDFCICRAAAGCRDFPIELGCLFLGEAALGINPELGWQFGSEERDYGFRTRCTKLVDIRETIQFPGKIKLDNSTLPEKAQINGQYADMTLSASVDGKTVETSLKLVLKKRVYPADAWKNFQDVVSGYQKIADTWYRIAY